MNKDKTNFYTPSTSISVNPELIETLLKTAVKYTIDEVSKEITQQLEGNLLYKATSKDVQKTVCLQEVMKYLTDHCVTWKFIVERARRWGCLETHGPFKCIGRTSLNHDKLS